MPRFTILNDRRFWLFFAFALTLLGFPRGILLDWIYRTGSLADLNHPGGADFVTFWVAAKGALSGHAGNLYDPSFFSRAMVDQFGEDFDMRWLYPPHFLLLIFPLGALPYSLAYTAFQAIGLVAFASLGILAPRRCEMSLWLVFAPTSILCLLVGQTALLVGALFIGAIFLWGRKPVLAGVFLGVLTIKPQFGVLIPLVLLIERRWLVIASATMTTCALVALSGLIFGFGSWRDFILNITGPQGDVLRANAKTFLEIQMSVYGGMRLAGFEPYTAMLTQIAVGSAAIIALISTLRSSARRYTKLAMLVTSTYLCVPYILFYDLAAPTFIAIWLYLGHGLEKRAGFALSILLVLVATLSFVNGVTVAMGFSAGPWVFAALATALFFRAREESAHVPEHQRSHQPDETTPRAGDRAVLANGSAAS
ncbi:DUF2029 domain-containing protein [Afifella sp. JA880]|uniref:glycosyltransferase family 87 protein n=1 Tax=Afifella sp. JA880 TaxID=2975280 RepID=UPI0021BA4F49|nr:glycosyltransferase family 87 protein [Afifella sp. JA880]MCT8268889.1 DUF2029 domain-containing protein [Afifella sp. JA880]